MMDAHPLIYMLYQPPGASAEERKSITGQPPMHPGSLLVWTGGISEVRKIASYAQVHYVPVAPHNYGPLSSLALTHPTLWRSSPTPATSNSPPATTPTGTPTSTSRPSNGPKVIFPCPKRPGIGRELSAAVLEGPRTSLESD